MSGLAQAGAIDPREVTAKAAYHNQVPKGLADTTSQLPLDKLLGEYDTLMSILDGDIASLTALAERLGVNSPSILDSAQNKEPEYSGILGELQKRNRRLSYIMASVTKLRRDLTLFA